MRIRYESRKCRDRRCTKYLAVYREGEIELSNRAWADNAAREAVQSRVDPALQTLIEEHRQAIDLTYFDGLTSEECAAKLGVSLSLFNWWKKRRWPK